MLRFLPLSLLVFLTACNGGEDFSDADLGGPVIQPSPVGDPLNPEATATEVEFAVGGSADGDSDYLTGVVNNMGYSCGSISSYIPRPGNAEGFTPNVARCAKDATSITFFLGPTQAGEEDKRVVLGTAYLPAESAQGRYQITPADLIESPSRLAPSDQRAYFRAALIQALDADVDANNDPTQNTPNVIDIPDEAHDLLLNERASHPPASPAFDYVDYSAFKSAWQPWVGELDNRMAANLMLPTNQTEAQQQLRVTLERMRGGTFNAQSLGLTEYGFVLQQLGRNQNIAFQMSTLVFPDGNAIGAGLSLLKGSDPQDSIVALRGDAQVDVVNQLSNWNAQEISLSQPSVTLGLQGRILGTFAYYVEGNDRIDTDFSVDYPNSDYVPKDPEKARYTASGLGDPNTDSVSDGLWWLTRTGQVAVNWEPAVVSKLNNDNGQATRFYDMEFRRACSDSSWDQGYGDCPTYNNGVPSTNGTYEIPDAEFDLNYSETMDLDGAGSQDPGITYAYERPKEWGNDLNTRESLRVQILDNGDVVTDIDRDCSPVDPADYQDQNDGTQEYRVGFVTRTSRDSAGDPESFNVVLLMTGTKPGASEPVHAAHDEIPHYAVQVGGRIDVSGDPARFGNMYRLGDSNFSQGIRGFWTDFYLPPQKEEKYGSGATFPQRHEIAVSSSGSVEGNPVDASGSPGDAGYCEPQ